MKKLMLAACLMFGGATLVSAQVEQTTPGQTQSQTQQTQDQDRQQISVSELPDQVTAKLEGQDYSGWTVGNAYKKMDESNQEMYIVELRQGTETKKVKFDKDGNELEKGKHGDESSNYRDDASQTDPSATPDQSTTDQSATDQSATDQSTTEQSTSEQSTTDQADNTGTETDQQ